MKKSFRSSKMYSARITRQNPTAFIFLIDQSGSMEEKMQFGNRTTTKAEAVAIVTNMLIRELINRCRKEEGVMDYFNIAAIGYSHDNARMLLGSESRFVKPSTLAAMECAKREITKERVLPSGKTAITTEMIKYWIEPRAEGNTPMGSAMEMALRLTTTWCRKAANSQSYPPTIFNITDGEATDCDYEGLVEISKKIKSLGTEDGGVLLININVSGASEEALIFPTDKSELPESRYTEMLYDISSTMPEQYEESILRIKPDSKPPFRGMGLNTSIGDIIAMMNIGSRSINATL